MPTPTVKKPSIAEPVTELRKIPIRENGERLVNFMERCPDLIWDKPRFHYRREQMLRESVAEMLCEANGALPRGLKLAIIEGWRAPYIQRRMYRAVENQIRKRNPDWSETKIRRVTNQFSAPMHNRVPPPHTTGAAVDLMVAHDNGDLLDHISPYEFYNPRGFHFDAAGLSDTARRTREILAQAFAHTKITNYPSEFWHWSFGDQGWAYRGGHSQAIYGAVQPENWEPAAEDMLDQPLQFIDGRPD